MLLSSQLLLFGFAFKESLLDLSCESAVSGLWVVLMSLDTSCQGNSKLLIVSRLGSEGNETRPQKSRLCEQATGGTPCVRREVGEGVPAAPFLPGCLALCDSASNRLPEQQKRLEPFITVDPWHSSVAAHISRVAFCQAGILAGVLCQDLHASPVGLESEFQASVRTKWCQVPQRSLQPLPPRTHLGNIFVILCSGVSSIALDPLPFLSTVISAYYLQGPIDPIGPEGKVGQSP